MKTVFIPIIIALALLDVFLVALLLYSERRRFDAELRLEEKDELLDFFGVDLMDADDEEEGWE